MRIESPWARGALVLAVLGGFALWEFGIKGPRMEAEAYSGTVVEKSRSRNWWRGLRQPGEPAYRYYTYSLTLRLESGGTREVKVPHSLYTRANPGDAIRKLKGERWPKLDTAAAREGWQMIDSVW